MPYLRPKWPKSKTYLRPQRLKNHTLLGLTYQYSTYKGLPQAALLNHTARDIHPSVTRDRNFMTIKKFGLLKFVTDPVNEVFTDKT